MDKNKYRYIGLAFRKDNERDMELLQILEGAADKADRSLTYTIKDILWTAKHTQI